MHRCIALSCLLVKALSVYLKVYFLSIVHILCKFNRFSRGGRISSVFGCNYFFILGFILGARVLPTNFYLILISITNYISCLRICRVNSWNSVHTAYCIISFFQGYHLRSRRLPTAFSARPLLRLSWLSGQLSAHRY